MFLSRVDRALSDLRTREAQLCGAFEQAINEDNTTVILSEAELDGLTDLDRFEAAAEPGHYIIGLKAPQALPVLTRAKIAVRSQSRRVMAADNLQSDARR